MLTLKGFVISLVNFSLIHNPITDAKLQWGTVGVNIKSMTHVFSSSKTEICRLRTTFN